MGALKNVKLIVIYLLPFCKPCHRIWSIFPGSKKPRTSNLLPGGKSVRKSGAGEPGGFPAELTK
jgi:hypothetical protein